MATHPESPDCCMGPAIRGHYTDMVLQVDMRLDAYESVDSTWGAVSVRNTNEGSYNFDLHYDTLAKQIRLAAGLDDRETYQLLQQPPGFDAAEGRWHNVIVVLIGDQIAYFLDGELQAAFSDATLTGGSFTMYAGWGTALSVDNLRIWEIIN